MSPLSVAILCGGQSRRLGTDKALVSLVPGGPSLLAMVVNRVRDLTDDLFLVGIPRPSYEGFGVPLVTDHSPGLGPLGGIATALRQAQHPDCLVVACDMPFLSQPLLTFLAEQPRAAYDVLAPLVPRDLTNPAAPLVFQPLHAIYRRSCLPAIATQLATTERRVTAFYGSVRVKVITAQQVSRFDPGLKSFFSVNTPDALDQAQDWLAGSPPVR